MRFFRSYVHKHVQRAFISEEQGWGLFAMNRIRKRPDGGPVIIEDRGYLISVGEFFGLDYWIRSLAFPTKEMEFLSPMLPGQATTHENVDDCFLSNHSCDPNIERSKENFFLWIPRRDIQEGEQITAEYATLQVGGVNRRYVRAHECWDFECECGASECRGRITDRDWSLPQFRGPEYDGQFPAYIDAARKAMRRKKENRDRCKIVQLSLVQM